MLVKLEGMRFIAEGGVGILAHPEDVAEIFAFCVGEKLIYGAFSHFYSRVAFAQEIYRIVHIIYPFFRLFCVTEGEVMHNIKMLLQQT